MAKADFSVVVDLGLPITKNVHDGECIAQFGLGSQTLYFETGLPVDVHKLSARELSERLSTAPEKINNAQQHSYAVHLLYDGTDNLLIDSWLRQTVFSKLTDVEGIVQRIQNARRNERQPLFTPLSMGVAYPDVKRSDKPLAHFDEHTPTLHEVTQEAELSGELVESAKALNNQFDELLRTTLRTKLVYEKARCETLVRKRDRIGLIAMLREETNVWIDREFSKRFDEKFSRAWHMKLRELGDEPSYVLVEQQKEQLAIAVRAEVYRELRLEKKQKLKKSTRFFEE